jgi:phage FluMu gp28-like protein
MVSLQTPTIKLPVQLYPYQRAWIDDKSRKKIAKKSRRIGFSWAEGLDNVLQAHERKQNFIILSRKGDLAKEYIRECVVPHVRTIGLLGDYIEGYLPGTSQTQDEVSFSNGSRIIALSANPDSARSYEGHVTLDEYGFHRDARAIYVAITPSITRGYSLKIISTTNGQQGTYYDLSKEAGLVDGRPYTNRFSAHKVDILQAIAQGCLDRNGHVLDAAQLRADCLDEDMWLQEYMCEFVSTAQQWISPELLEANLSEEAVSDRPHIDLRNLYAGWDIARHKDLSVVWFLERVGDLTITRGIVEFVKEPTPNQSREAVAFMKMCNRMCVDQSGMGLSIYESLEEKFRGQVEGITFTLANKEIMAVHAKRRMEARKTRIPDTDMIRNSFRSVKKTVTATGQARFDAEHDVKYGHADHWWAYCLAEHAAGVPSVLGVVEYGKKEQAALDEMKKVKTSPLQKPTTNDETERCPNPDCGATAIVRVAGQKRCSACGHQWGNVKTALSDKPGTPGRGLMK